MTGTLQLTKHHGLGNDFLVAFVDRVPDDGAALAVGLCARRTGVGADGLILATPGVDDGTVGFTLFNSDGSPAEVSGNGLRCLGQALAVESGCSRVDVTAVTAAGPRRVLIEAEAQATTVAASVEMGPVAPGIELPDGLVGRLADQGGALSGLAELRQWSSADLGNPHVVFDVAHLGAIQIDRFGPAVEALLGAVNVEVIAVHDRARLDMSVWERGAGVTMACGSGACAAAHAARQWGLVDDQVQVTMPGGEAQVDLSGPQVVLTGPATFIGWVEVPHG
ncbi:MAG: diaminopimelate epimerase [Acidimicrobiia bacterium]|nr:diaminopimelate epimerase [Acidimicrobiia bacterium]MDH5236794.1 diaminopimelate epimerase [Acidimicrobiia bacterium]